ncbi:DUF397 domain-containing protein [Actinomadura sp. NBRC 104412]
MSGVEVAALPDGIGVRDSKNPCEEHLALTRQQFADLVVWIRSR